MTTLMLLAPLVINAAIVALVWHALCEPTPAEAAHAPAPAK